MIVPLACRAIEHHFYLGFHGAGCGIQQGSCKTLEEDRSRQHQELLFLSQVDGKSAVAEGVDYGGTLCCALNPGAGHTAEERALLFASRLDPAKLLEVQVGADEIAQTDCETILDVGAGPGYLSISIKTAKMAPEHNAQFLEFGLVWHTSQLFSSSRSSIQLTYPTLF